VGDGQKKKYNLHGEDYFARGTHHLKACEKRSSEVILDMKGKNVGQEGAKEGGETKADLSRDGGPLGGDATRKGAGVAGTRVGVIRNRGHLLKSDPSEKIEEELSEEDSYHFCGLLRGRKDFTTSFELIRQLSLEEDGGE